MNIKKLVSAASALTIAVSAFAGITASAATYTAVDSIIPTLTSSRNVFTKAQNAGETLVFEFDIKVDDQVKASLAYYSNENLGATYVFDASHTSHSGETVVGYVTITHNTYPYYTEINKNHAYSFYATGATAHVVIETPVVATNAGLGNSTIIVTPATAADKSYFMQTNSSGNLTQRNPKNDRDIGARNLSSRALNNIRFTIETAEGAAEGATATITNAVLYTKAANVTISAPNATVSGISAGAVARNTYAATVQADDGYEVTGVTVDGETIAAEEDGTYTIIVNGDKAVAVTTQALTSPTPVTATLVEDFSTDGDSASVWSATVTGTDETATYTKVTATAKDMSDNVGTGTAVLSTPITGTGSAAVYVVIPKTSSDIQSGSVTVTLE